MIVTTGSANIHLLLQIQEKENKKEKNLILFFLSYIPYNSFSYIHHIVHYIPSKLCAFYSPPPIPPPLTLCLW